MAETYGILDYKALPAQKLVTLFSGLREGSRTYMALQGMKVPIETQMLAMAVDRLSYLWWSKTKDAEKNRNRPQSITQIILKEDKKDDTLTFTTGEEFTKAREQLLRGMKNGT